MVRSDRDIRSRLHRGDLEIAGILDEDRQLQPASVDLRSSAEFLTFKPALVDCLDPREPATLIAGTERVVVPIGGSFTVHPGEFVLGSTMERVAIPNDLVARVDGRSSVGCLGIVVHATAGFIDPGFQGEITLELCNIGRIPFRLYPGMRIAQIVFHTMTSPAERPYGEGRKSHYLGQEGPQASRISLDD